MKNINKPSGGGTGRFGFTLAEVSMSKRTSGMENEILHSRESETKEPSYLGKKFSAFTLAEVLITLAIIGVVAALTVPSVIVKYEKQQVPVKLKKAYNSLFQAVTASEAVNGSHTTWDYNLSGSDFFERYLDGYIVVKKEKTGDSNIEYKGLNGDPVTLGAFQPSRNGYNFTLSDGTKVIMDGRAASADETRSRLIFVFDLNGDKKPNVMGKDLFVFHLSSKKGLVPHYVSDGEAIGDFPTRATLKAWKGSAQRYECNSKRQGTWCAALIMMDGWKIADDYPWK